MVDVQKKDSGIYICQISSHSPMGLHTIVRVKGTNVFIQNMNKSQTVLILFRAHDTDVW